MPTNEWQPIRTDDGSFTLAHPIHGETCHSRAGAWHESRERYARACRVRERALELARAGSTTFRLLDVGTGLGLNLAAALEALEGTGVELDALSLELEPAVIERTLGLAHAHPLGDAELERHHAPVRAALRRALDRAPRTDATVALGTGRVRLVLGDARRTLALAPIEARFDAVFLDPFSPAVDAALWELGFLREIARRMARASLLSTYSASLTTRAGLCASGLRVGLGARVGTKSAGTLASPDLELDPLPARIARKVERRAQHLFSSAPALTDRILAQGGHSDASML